MTITTFTPNDIKFTIDAISSKVNSSKILRDFVDNRCELEFNKKANTYIEAALNIMKNELGTYDFDVLEMYYTEIFEAIRDVASRFKLKEYKDI